MNTEQYRDRLLELETRLSDRAARVRAQGRDRADGSPGDAGDASVAEESASRNFSEAELDSTNLQQVRDALRRIDEGTFGRCIVDGEPIEEKRLEAIPWTPYCLKHQEALEAVSPPATPTL